MYGLQYPTDAHNSERRPSSIILNTDERAREPARFGCSETIIQYSMAIDIYTYCMIQACVLRYAQPYYSV